ncbi:hypothetical protein BsWGS_02297 [Bradybaena similaris]
MAVTGFVKVLKWILVALNVPILCAGAIAIGLGAWGLGSEFGADRMKDLTGNELYRGSAIAIIVGGSVLVVIALVGILGAVLENRWLLGVYFVIMLLLLILFVTAAAVGFAFRDEIRKELIREMESSLKNRYDVQIDDNDDNFRTTKVWDDIQAKLDCCGVSGGLDSQKSWFLWQSSQWYLQQSVPAGGSKDLVPPSCCTSETTDSACQKASNTSSVPPQLYSNATLNQDNPVLNEKGCLTAIEDYIFNRVVAIAGISVAILIVMFFCILLAVVVCINVGRTKAVSM